MDSEEELINNAIESNNSQNYYSALENYNKFIELNPDYKEVHYNKGVTFQKLSKYEESLEAFSKPFELYKNLAILYFHCHLSPLPLVENDFKREEDFISEKNDRFYK